MRRSKAEKADTHSKIVSVAAKRLRERGLQGIGISDLMEEAGVTTGGFYKHFGSRDDLVIEALGEAFRHLDKMEREAEDLPALLTEFLSEAHCADPGTGCAITSLAGDVRQASTAVQAVFTERVKHNLTYYADRSEGSDVHARRSKAIMLFSAALGGLTLARAVNDKALSREILVALREQIIPMSRRFTPRGTASSHGSTPGKGNARSMKTQVLRSE
jgi:TetR/AcrR family transcriptional regulator, transcriptional repressor for nem operon